MPKAPARSEEIKRKDKVSVTRDATAPVAAVNLGTLGTWPLHAEQQTNNQLICEEKSTNTDENKIRVEGVPPQ